MGIKLRLPLSILGSAALLTLASAPYSLAFLAMIALLPLMWMMEERASVRFLSGWLAGALFQAVGYYWIFFTIRDFGGLSAGVSGVGAALFWLYQGLDLGLWMLITPVLCRGRTAWQKVLIVPSAFLFVHDIAFPYIFPWQYGATFITLPGAGGLFHWLNSQSLALLAVLFQSAVVFSGQNKRFLWLLGMPVLLIAGLALPRAQVETEVWKIAVIQPNLIPWAKQDGLSVDELFQAHYQPTLALVDEDLEMVIWPETGLSFNLDRFPYYKDQLQTLADKWDCAVVTGALGLNSADQLYNSVWLFSPETDTPQIYRKEKLVWFSESVPWLFSWAKFFDPGMGSFAPGENNKPFEFRNRKLTPMVCYEALMTWYVAQHSQALILNLTNDAWFGDTRASAQHLSQVQPRSAENGVPLVRATNSGISCWVDTNGVIRNPSPLYEAGAYVYSVPVPLEKPIAPARWIGLLLSALAFIITTTAVVSGLWFSLAKAPKSAPSPDNPRV